MQTLTKDGHEPESYLTTTDVDGDGTNEVIAIFGFLPLQNRKNVVFCYNANGKERWEYEFHRNMTFGTERFADAYICRFLIAHDFAAHGQPEILVIAIHDGYYPTDVVRLFPSNGNLLGEYWLSGDVTRVDHRDIDGDGVEELVLTGENNGYDRASLAILDPTRITGHTPAPPDYTPQGIPSGLEKYYVLFPRNDLAPLAQFKRNEVRAFVAEEKSSFRVYVGELVQGGWYSVIYHFNSALECIRVDGEDGFVTVHHKLEADAKLTKKLDARYYEDLRQGVQYWDGEKFVNIPTMNKRYLAAKKEKPLP